MDYVLFHICAPLQSTCFYYLRVLLNLPVPARILLSHRLFGSTLMHICAGEHIHTWKLTDSKSVSHRGAPEAPGRNGWTRPKKL